MVLVFKKRKSVVDVLKKGSENFDINSPAPRPHHPLITDFFLLHSQKI